MGDGRGRSTSHQVRKTPVDGQMRLSDYDTPKFEQRDAGAQMAHREAAKRAIDDGIDGSVTIEYGGSVSKGTYVEGISDVDCRVAINGTSLEEKTPKEILRYMEKQIVSHDPSVKSCSVGRLAVTVVYKDGTEMQFIPVIKGKYSYKIPEGNHWSRRVYEGKFKRDFDRVNRTRCGGKLHLLVRILKDENVKRPKSQQLSGHHIEVLAERVFRQYPKHAPKNISSLYDYFTRHSGKYLSHRIRDRTGQSTYVDKTDLGGPNSVQRLRVITWIRNLHARHTPYKCQNRRCPL